MSNLHQRINEALGYSRRLEHPDDVKASVSKVENGWRLVVDFGTELPEMNTVYYDPTAAVRAVEDLQAIGFLVRGTDALEDSLRGGSQAEMS